MKWTTEKIAELCALAPTGVGAKAISERLGCTPKAVLSKGTSLRVQIVDRFGTYHPATRRATDGDGKLRQRWAAMIGPMKDDLRADLARIG